MMNLTIKPVDLPDGKYDATWSGHKLEIQAEGKVVKTETTIGIKSINVRIKIKVTGGLVEKIQDETT
jgi:hypothetical protein